MAATRDVSLDDEFRSAQGSPCPDLPFSSVWNSADYSAGPSTGTTGAPPVPVEPPTRFGPEDVERMTVVDIKRMAVLGDERMTVDIRRTTVDLKRMTVDGHRTTVDLKRRTVKGKIATVDVKTTTVDLKRKTVEICNGRPKIAFGERLQEEIFVQTIKSFPNNEPDLSHEFVEISQNTRSPQGPQAYPNGADMQIGSSEQQPTVDFDVTCNRGNQSDIPVTGSEKNNIKMISPLLSPEILPQLYGMKQDDAAKFLGVSRSTLRRECRKQGIPKWPFRKGKKGSNYLPKLNRGNESVRGTEGVLCQPSLTIGPINRAELRRSYLQPTESIPSAPYCVPNTPVSKKAKVVLESSETVPQCSELPREHRVSSIVHAMTDVAAMQDMKIFNIKATYRIGIIQFPLSSSSRKAELEENISKRLKLNLGNFKIKYMDTDDDKILITCDEDLQYCMIASERLGHKTIKMFVEDIANT